MDALPADGADADAFEVDLTYSGTRTRFADGKRYVAAFHGHVCFAPNGGAQADPVVDVIAGPPGASAVIADGVAILRIPVPAIRPRAKTPARSSAAP